MTGSFVKPRAFGIASKTVFVAVSEEWQAQLKSLSFSKMNFKICIISNGNIFIPKENEAPVLLLTTE